MPISVTCPECSSTYRVPDDAAGKAIKCKKCGARVPVSAGGEEEAPAGTAAANGDEAAVEGGGKAKTPKKSSTKLIAIIAGSLAFVCCCCVTPGGYFGSAGYFGFWPFGGGGTKGNLVLEKKETLTDKDPAKANGKHAKEYKVKLEQGKNYVIDLKADKKFDPTNLKIDLKNPPHDPVLILLDPSGKQVAFNDDAEPGRSFDSQIRYTPTQTGEFTIQASVLVAVPPGGMPFTLTVRQQ